MSELIEIAPLEDNVEVGSDGEREEPLSPEMVQRKLYFLLEHLKKMHSELPE